MASVPAAGAGRGTGAAAGGGGAAGGVAAGCAAGPAPAHAAADRAAPTTKRRRVMVLERAPHGVTRSVLVRPKMATSSGPSLETRSSFQPRLRMSARQPRSFCHSSLVVRNTRRSATDSHWAGYGLDVIAESGGRWGHKPSS